MSAVEIAHRTRSALRDRLLPPRWTRWSAEIAGTRLFDPVADPMPAARWGPVTRLPGRDELGGTLEAAARLGSGRWTRFGREVQLADPPRWNVDPGSGAAWPDLASQALDYRRTDLAGGAKGVWEAGRLTMLPTLALAARHEIRGAHADRARRWLDDFVARNPAGHGIHHTSGIEMAIRAITMSWTLALLDHDDGALHRNGEFERTRRAALGLVAQQAFWCRDHLSLGSSANNHLLSEYAAMVVAGAGLPGLRGGARMLDQGLRGIEHEVERQIHPDGVGAEQAHRYLPFVWELLLPALRLAESAGRTVGHATRARLAASLEFARAMRRADGTMPPIGDEDDARVLLADEAGTRLDLAGNALAAWLGAPGLAPGRSALATLLTGNSPGPAVAAPDGEHAFEHGGCTVWRSRAAFATFDHGPLGLGPLAAHGHADALSITLRLGEDDLIVDPGTLAYHEDEAARTATRGTPSHSTIHFGGRSQSEMLGPFLWGRRARVGGGTDGRECTWWSGERHVRRVTFADGEIVLHDHAEGPAPEITFALAPGAEVQAMGPRAEVVAGGARLAIESEGIEGWRVEAGEVATGYAVRRSAPRLAARLRERDLTTRLRFGPR